jgi:hypothetical protein
MAGWDDVEVALDYAQGIAWDTCHKIYILMDDRQFELMGEYGYDPLIHSDDMSAEDMLAMVRDWFDNSCGLRFVSSVKTVDGDANKGFKDLIPQGYYDDDDYDEDEEEE